MTAYPASEVTADHGNMHSDRRTVLSVKSRDGIRLSNRIYYEHKNQEKSITEYPEKHITAPGFSGAAAWTILNGQKTAVAVHTLGVDGAAEIKRSNGVRIDGDVRDFVDFCIQKPTAKESADLTVQEPSSSPSSPSSPSLLSRFWSSIFKG
jgi:hypothetical protein